MEKTLPHSKKVSWSDVYSAVHAVNKGLAEQLQQAIGAKKQKTKEPKLFTATYRYGESLVTNGQLSPPCNQCAVCKELAQASCNIPLTFVLDKYVEVYINSPDGRDIPLRLLRPGELFGLFETLDTLVRLSPEPPWSVSAGVRSVKVLYPLGNPLRKKIRLMFNRSIDPKEEVQEFIRLAAEKMGQQWSLSILIFPDAWLKEILTPELTNEVFRMGWLQSENLRKRLLDDFFIAATSLTAIHKGGTNVGQLYRYATIRQLLLIAKGEAPAFQLTVQGEALLGPFDSFQRFLIDLALNEHFPVVLHARELTSPKAVGYYSLRQPSLLYPIHEAPDDKWLQRLNELVETLDNIRSNNSAFDISGWTYLSGEKDRVKPKGDKPLQFSYETLQFSYETQGPEPQTGQIMNPSTLKEEFLRDSGKTHLSLYTGHPFFKACVRIIRQ